MLASSLCSEHVSILMFLFSSRPQSCRRVVKSLLWSSKRLQTTLKMNTVIKYMIHVFIDIPYDQQVWSQLAYITPLDSCC